MVNVYTEWGELREIVVGSCYNITDYNVDTSFRLFFLKNIQDTLIKRSIKLQTRLVEQRQEDLDAFASLLEKDLGIKVFRPNRLKEVKSFTTPNFTDVLCPVDNPRDQTLIIGNEIIETSCQWRRRYFENDLMKSVFMHYFKNGAKWTCSPRPRMTDDSFDFLNMPWEENQDLRFKQNNDLDLEIMFDGAQCLKFGRDIIMNVSTKNHELGAQWLKGHLEDKFNIHVVKITDHHIDGMFMPLKPGVLLINQTSMYDKLHLLPKKLQKWKILKVPHVHDEIIAGESLASDNINVNVLPISERKVILFSHTGNEDSKLAEMIAKEGIEPVTIRLRHSRMFGGGAHCATLDMVREDSCENYL